MFEPLTLQPREEPAPAPATAPATAIERVAAARPDLDRESPEFRAAVLLLLTAEIGYNVDRIMARTRYPRELVARCLRRLVDNGVRLDARLATRWWKEYMTTNEFWLDVEVALGRYLRRIGADGRPEWAPAGEWVKSFEYRRGEPEVAAANEYHRIEPYHPEPAAGEEVDVPPEREAQNRAADPPAEPPSGPIATRPDPAAPLVESWRSAVWLG